LPKKILDRVIQKLTALGINIQTNKELGKNLTRAELKDYDSLFVATGVHLSAVPEMTGTGVEGVYNGLDFLKAVALGHIKSFAKRVAVIGGGNTAIDAARTVLRLGGNPIIYYRRSQEELPAIQDEINDCKHEGIEFQYLVTPVRVISKQNSVSSVEFIRNKLGEPDKSQRRTPIPLEGSNFQVKAEAVILATGETADLRPFVKLIDTDHGLIKVNEFGQSSDKSIFAGGDVTQNQHRVVDAINSGKRAAIGIDCHLKGIGKTEIISLVKSISNKHGSVSFKKYINKDFSSNDQPVIQYEDLNDSYFEHLARNERRELPLESRTSSFKEVRAKFTKSEANKEAERCFSCGECNSCGNCFVLCPDGSVIFDKSKEMASQMEYNYDYCKGCGICVEECPRGVIQMVQEE
jgi:NADPH-dependent glutamate synthase beta subunit-like oxidoreductase